MTGKVWLVGAGPGDVGLMTLKGREVLQQAEVVVYDALVSDGVLGLIPEGAKLIFAGKRSGNHFLRQEETNQVLLDGYADADAWCVATAERAFVRQLDGGCTSPVCAHATLHGDIIRLTGLYYEESDGSWRKGAIEGLRSEAEQLGIQLARTLRDGREA